MKLRRTLSIAVILIMALVITLFAVSCGETETTDTYYLYKNEKTDTSSWVKLTSKNQWSDSDSMSGRYTLNGENIVFYVTFDGEEEELLRGTLTDAKLTIGDSMVSVVYYLDGSAPDSNGTNSGNGNGNGSGNGTENGSGNGTENGSGNEGGNEESYEELLSDFTYEIEDGKYIITGVKNKKVTSLVVPDFVSEIKDSAFYECTGLEHITVPFVGTSRDYYAGKIAEFAVIFKGETAIIEENNKNGITGGIHRPGDIVSGVGSYEPVYSYVSGLKSIVVTGDILSSVYFASYNNTLESVELKGSVYGISTSSLKECRTLKKAILGTSVQTIGDYAFSFCSQLNELTISAGLVSIGNNAFQYCENLTEITLPDTLTSIGDFAFDTCSSLQSFAIPKNLTSIGLCALINLSALENLSVDAQNTAYKIKDNCLVETATKTLLIGLSGAKIPSDGSVSVIGKYAFYQNESITEVVIPAGVSTISESAFSGCSNLQTVVINEGLTFIEHSVFNSCYALKSIVIPDTVTEIGTAIFGYCSSLESLTVPFIGSARDNVTDAYIGYFFQASYSSNEKNANVPTSLTEVTITKDDVIYADAFRACSSIRKIVIGEGVTKIENAFARCTSLAEVSIPKSVTELTKNCFSACSALTTIHYNGTASEWESVSKGKNWNQSTGEYKIYCLDTTLNK